MSQSYNGNNNGASMTSVFQFGSGVGSNSTATLPSAQGTSKQANNPSGTYTGPLAGSSFLGQPFAVWLGLILVLIALKFLSESPKTSINPAKIEIGGYNWLAVGVSAATFIAIFKVMANKFPVPGVTEFANAL